MQQLLTYRDTAVEALNHLDEFSQKMDTFIEEHENYSYTTSISKTNKGWKINVILKKEEDD